MVMAQSNLRQESVMAVRHLFVARAQPAAAGVVRGLTAGDTGTDVPVFITPQSLASFPVASAVVTTLWALATKMFPWGASTTVLLVLSLVVGGIIFAISVSSPASQPKEVKGWLVAGAIAVINSLLLAAAALGVLGKAGAPGPA